MLYNLFENRDFVSVFAVALLAEGVDRNTACVGYLITYAGKSLGEKISRNRHGLDADGNPLPDPSGDTLNNEEAKG